MADTPMVTGLQLCHSDNFIPISPEILKWRVATPYRELVGSLMYLAVTTCPDIAFTVRQLSPFLDCYTSNHWSVAMRILRYLKGT